MAWVGTGFALFYAPSTTLETIMNRSIYQNTRASIRTNGLAYTARRAIETGDTATLYICDAYADSLTQPDWLALRAKWSRSGTDSKATTIRLTSFI